MAQQAVLAEIIAAGADRGDGPQIAVCVDAQVGLTGCQHAPLDVVMGRLCGTAGAEQGDHRRSAQYAQPADAAEVADLA